MSICPECVILRGAVFVLNSVAFYYPVLFCDVLCCVMLYCVLFCSVVLLRKVVYDCNILYHALKICTFVLQHEH